MDATDALVRVRGYIDTLLASERPSTAAPNESDEWLTIQQAARRLNMSTQFVTRNLDRFVYKDFAPDGSSRRMIRIRASSLANAPR